MIVFVAGTSLTPSQGSHTQKIPPITSVNDSNVKSVAGIFFDPIEYKIKPEQTSVPWVANKASFLLVDKKFKSLIRMNAVENMQQNNPAIATVVNFGVLFLHLKVTEKIEKPNAEARPKIRPGNVFFSILPNAIMAIPNVATKIDIQTDIEIFSFKNINPRRAVMNGIAAKHSNDTAADVFVIDQINVIMAVARPTPPNIPEIPIFE